MSSSSTNRGLRLFLYTLAALIVLLLGVLVLQFTPIKSVAGFFLLPSATSTFALYDPSNPGTQSPTPFQPLPTETPTNTPTSTPTLIPTPTKTPKPTKTLIPPTPTNLPYQPGDSLPASASISGVTGYIQQHTLSCEARSAVDWARFFGVSITEAEFLSSFPISTNPDRGFVGSWDGPLGQIPPASYGVHASPVAKALRAFGLSATAYKEYSFDELRAQVAAGYPVIVWVIGNTWSGIPVYYTAPDGRTTVVANFEHTAIVTGYDDYGLTLVDNDLVYWRSTSVFLDSWSVLGNMVIVAQ